MRVIEASFRTCLSTLEVRTSHAPQFIDITDRVSEAIAESRVQDGMVCVFSKHTTLATVIQENEPLLMTDLASFVERLAPRGAHYRHNDFGVRTVNMHEGECPNGHSHCQHLVLGTSQTIPIVDGRMTLGQWQRIFALELDADKALQIDTRQVDVQVMGI
ncbi:MAG: secondary thiamine-phosphate synthase enzyme YjbQ [Dehalococcoidia bacterium]|nr:secondary thiamine-phosphate synthase enzyme YjbQ [Dehalococcoidia bacterium]